MHDLLVHGLLMHGLLVQCLLVPGLLVPDLLIPSVLNHGRMAKSGLIRRRQVRAWLVWRVLVSMLLVRVARSSPLMRAAILIPSMLISI